MSTHLLHNLAVLGVFVGGTALWLIVSMASALLAAIAWKRLSASRVTWRAVMILWAVVADAGLFGEGALCAHRAVRGWFRLL